MSQSSNLKPSRTDDIEVICKDIEKNNMRATQEYMLGAQETWELISQNVLEKSLNTLRSPMEVMLKFLEKDFPNLSIKEVRIGIDYSSNEPVGLLIIDKSQSEFISDIRSCARQIERYYWSENRSSFLIWVIIGPNIDLESINRDFPYIRSEHANQQ